MNMQLNQLSVEMSVSPRITSGEDLEVRVTLSNRGQDTTRLNTLFLGSATIVLKMRRADETPVRPGPPPVPFQDDGQAGRRALAPGDSMTLVYRGRDYLGGKSLPPGTYQVKFVHANSSSEHGDWTGAVESEWKTFEIVEVGEGVAPRGG
jgi:hypothetical protein